MAHIARGISSTQALWSDLGAPKKSKKKPRSYFEIVFGLLVENNAFARPSYVFGRFCMSRRGSNEASEVFGG